MMIPLRTVVQIPLIHRAEISIRTIQVMYDEYYTGTCVYACMFP